MTEKVQPDVKRQHGHGIDGTGMPLMALTL